MDVNGTAAGIEPNRLRYWAAGLSLVAGLVHGAVTPDHLSEWWGYGLFFFSAALAQGGYGLLLLLRPWRYDETGGLRPDEDPSARQSDRVAYQVGVAGNAAVVALYVVTRTVGIPFFGPEAGEVEPVTPVGLLSKGLELALIGCLMAMLRRSPGSARRPSGGEARPADRGAGA